MRLNKYPMVVLKNTTTINMPVEQMPITIPYSGIAS